MHLLEAKAKGTPQTTTKKSWAHEEATRIQKLAVYMTARGAPAAPLLCDPGSVVGENKLTERML